MTDTFDVPGAALPLDADATPAADAVPMAPNGFLRLGLADELVRAVADLGFTQPTAVQDAAIPKALPQEHDDSGAPQAFSDLMVSSQTGSGKTAAFLLPVLHTLIRQAERAVQQEREDWERTVAEAAARGEAPPKRARRRDPTNPRHFKAAVPGALVLCPTRELAQQVAADAIDLVRHCRGIRIANVVGGIPYQVQIARLQNANLVVATPGRLLDLQRSGQIKLDQVQFLVVDEADRMLDLGFADDLAEINQLTIARGQTMMFSATFAPRIQQLAMRVMRNQGASVERVQIDSPQERHANIKQALFWADNAQHKRALLDHWLRDSSIDQAIVFASTQIECDALAEDLQQVGFSAVALHGALSQGLRNRRLSALRDGRVQILVATDVAARGIDVPTITHVFNFGLPMKAEDYTHRIGRTGRAGRDGLAVTFAEFRDRHRIFDIEGFTRQPFKAEVIPGLEPTQRFPSSHMNERGHRRGAGPTGGGRRGGAPGGGRGADRGGYGGGHQHHHGGGQGWGTQGAGGRRPANPHGGGARQDAWQDGPRGGGNRDPFSEVQRERSHAHRAGHPHEGAGHRGQGDPFVRGERAAGRGKPAPAGGPRGPKVFVPRDFAKKRPAR